MKCIQLNIERNKHLHRVKPFLTYENADIVLLQEIFREDAEYLATELVYTLSFAPMTLYPVENTDHVQGVAILTKRVPEGVWCEYYFGDGNIVRYIPVQRKTVHQPFLSVSLKDGHDHVWNVGTLHFGKSWRGKPDEYQRKIMTQLLLTLDSHPSIFFGGDMNIPRGTELYHTLSQKFHDHIPDEYINSLDATLHRIPNLSFMVDYFWSTPDYKSLSVRQVCGLSDHCAFVAEVERCVAQLNN